MVDAGFFVFAPFFDFDGSFFTAQGYVVEDDVGDFFEFGFEFGVFFREGFFEGAELFLDLFAGGDEVLVGFAFDPLESGGVGVFLLAEVFDLL